MCYSIYAKHRSRKNYRITVYRNGRTINSTAYRPSAELRFKSCRQYLLASETKAVKSDSSDRKIVGMRARRAEESGKSSRLLRRNTKYPFCLAWLPSNRTTTCKGLPKLFRKVGFSLEMRHSWFYLLRVNHIDHVKVDDWSLSIYRVSYLAHSYS